MMDYVVSIVFSLVALFPHLIYASDHNISQCELLTKKPLANLPASTGQILVVKSLGGFKVSITACQKTEMAWNQVLGSPFQGVVGKFGLTEASQKKEGDKKTPLGLYSLGAVFSPHPTAVKMDFKYITADDKYIDDVTSDQYNTWVTGSTKYRHENMMIDLYKLGLIINYNENPVVKGAGSAIFIHIWKTPETYTSGCVAMDEKNLISIVSWLEKNQHPYIYLTR